MITRKHAILATFFTTVLLGSAGISYAAFSQKEPIRAHLDKIGVNRAVDDAIDGTMSYGDHVRKVFNYGVYLATYTADYNAGLFRDWSREKSDQIKEHVGTAKSYLSGGKAQLVNATSEPPALTLRDMKAKQEWDSATSISTLEPSSGQQPPDIPNRWSPEQNDLTVEAVLVPRQVTVISSSQDGKIRDILVGQGDRFKKGDVLIQYDCADLEAEASIAGMQKDLTAKKSAGGDELFKLDIISDVDRLGVQIEDKQAASRIKLYQARLDHCQIRAQFDGRVTNRLANPGEYTRTDRVLMEVASDEPLQVEFMVPSKWLRWLNTGAPLHVKINETDASYTARVSRIYGEVDPVSQSIQMIALLDTYNDPLLPGMSGQAKLSINEIEDAGVKGYLQTPVGR